MEKKAKFTKQIGVKISEEAYRALERLQDYLEGQSQGYVISECLIAADKHRSMLRMGPRSPAHYRQAIERILEEQGEELLRPIVEDILKKQTIKQLNLPK